MIITNVNISQKSQEILRKAAAEKRMSVEDMASEILSDAAPSRGGLPHSLLHQDNEAIQNKLSGIATIGEVKSDAAPSRGGFPHSLLHQDKEYPILPLANKQPYAYYADPEEPAIPLEDWDMEKSSEEVL
ncbi:MULTISPECIES: hypothetical protein [Moorena]|uniref:Uncharacterized protein n=1 Tax=Moorena producens 3L TaxID=489825 RepID=F4XYY2_9CYAN|nr:MULTISPECIES: hypothetical protein [Moorena]EGJ30273.1 hypothetical protein LYNGBM3L_53110 [Moorena producens 3L]NEP35162.1 hypothetical protein [Moorena sp. SIO3B2]NEP69885.1 hypothetical protein [Moorena sp. SIO3A5]NEQ08805.1 hypothetical protein [Moorena sp. SIO4E2]NER91921.1 hypothetical protein [Moorena sp. SIO3A2]